MEKPIEKPKILIGPNPRSYALSFEMIINDYESYAFVCTSPSCLEALVKSASSDTGKYLICQQCSGDRYRFYYDRSCNKFVYERGRKLMKADALEEHFKIIKEWLKERELRKREIQEKYPTETEETCILS